MKTTQLIDAINEKIQSARDLFLLAGGAAFVNEETGDLRMDLEIWPEHTRTFTERGRAELQAEESAAQKIINFTKNFGRLEEDGYGDGQFGSIRCFGIYLN